MQSNPYLLFNGQCETAFSFYAKCLHGKIDSIFTFDGSPMANQIPAEWRKKVMHARMSFGENVLMGSDSPPGRYQKPQGFSVSVQVKEPAEAERIFRALSEGGQIEMPIQETFWAARFGMFVDKFGVPWMVNCEKTA